MAAKVLPTTSLFLPVDKGPAMVSDQVWGHPPRWLEMNAHTDAHSFRFLLTQSGKWFILRDVEVAFQLEASHCLIASLYTF